MSVDLEKLFFKYGVYYPVTMIQGGNLTAPLQALNQSQYASTTKLQNMQLEKLQRLLRHAKTTVPWHQINLKQCNPDKITNLSKFAELPLLSKAKIQTDTNAFHSTVNSSRLITKTSGGSTGQPLTILKSRYAWIHELAATWRGYGWAGIDIGDLQARFWGVPLDETGRWKAKLTDWICHRIRCSAFNFDEQDIQDYWDKLQTKQPRYLYGYASMLVEFAEHIKRSGESPGIKPRSIVTTAEALTKDARALLESVFNTKVYNEYGCGEIGTIAHECESGNLHLCEENVYVEIIRDGQPCAPGEAGEIVVTELNNRAMPLIRYQIGDHGSISANACSCGRTLRVLEGLHGRAYDFIYSSNGRKFHGEFMMYIFEGLKSQGVSLKQFQVHQKDIGKFLIRIVPDKELDSTVERKITDIIHNHVDESAQVSFELVDKIDRERSGKMRVIVGMETKAPTA